MGWVNCGTSEIGRVAPVPPRRQHEVVGGSDASGPDRPCGCRYDDRICV